MIYTNELFDATNPGPQQQKKERANTISWCYLVDCLNNVLLITEITL